MASIPGRLLAPRRNLTRFDARGHNFRGAVLSRRLLGADLRHRNSGRPAENLVTHVIRFNDGHIRGPLTLTRFFNGLMASIPGRLLAPRRNLTRFDARGHNFRGAVLSRRLLGADLRHRNGGRPAGNLVTHVIRFNDGRIRGPLTLTRFFNGLMASMPGRLLSPRGNLRQGAVARLIGWPGALNVRSALVPRPCPLTVLSHPSSSLHG